MSSHIRVTVLYAIFGVAWILGSDTLVEVLFGGNPTVLSNVQSAKGILYVLITSSFLFLLIYYENRLREKHEADFRLLFVHNPQPMGVYDRKTLQFLEVNDAAVKAYGYSRDEFLQLSVKDIYPDEDVPQLMERLKGGHNSRSGAREWRHQLKSGEIIHVDVIAQEISYQSHKAVFVAAWNVSERRQLESERLKNQALHAALDKEIAARSNRDRLASMVSHDLRTPLSIIMSSASMLDRYNDRFDSGQRTRHHQKILRQAKELNEELEEILLWLRSEANSSTFQPVKTDMIEFVKAILAEFTVPDKAQRVQLEVQSELLLVEIDPHLFARVISNLVSNACKYSADDSIVEIFLSSEHDQFCLRVHDYGIGIPEESQANLFDAFYRADNAVNVQGTGLGLSIVKEIIDLHQGRILVESAVGEGSTFTVFIPLTQAELH